MILAEEVKSWGSRSESGVLAKRGPGTKVLISQVQEGVKKWVPRARSSQPHSAPLPALRTPEAQFRSFWMKRVADAILRLR